MYIRKETLSMKLLRILKNQLKNSWFLFAFIIVALILWNTNRLFQNLSVEQRTKMELWAMAQEEYIQNQNFSNLTFEVLQRSGINPMIQVDKDGYILEIRNIPWIKEKQDSTDLYKILSQLKKENDPIIIQYEDNTGLQTNVGERGNLFSGGQIKRIAIARALYNDKKILLLDEATSSLDKATQSSFYSVISSLKGALTIIIVTHDLSELDFYNVHYELLNKKLILKDKN